MDREELQLHLALALQRVAEGKAQIAKQRRIIEGLEAPGLDTTRAKNFLTTLLKLQALHEQDRYAVKQELEGHLKEIIDQLHDQISEMVEASGELGTRPRLLCTQNL